MAAKKQKAAAKKAAPAPVAPMVTSTLAPRRSAPVDTRGKIRVYADIDSQAAIDLGVLALRNRTTRKSMLESLISQAVKAQAAS
jgi:hypothetical protein